MAIRLVQAARLASERARQQPSLKKPPTEQIRRLTRAEEEMRQPWMPALRAVEEATFDPVFLLSASFDRASGQVKLEAESPDFEQALVYLQYLSSKKPLSGAALASHEQRPDTVSGGSLVRFTVLARWNSP